MTLALTSRVETGGASTSGPTSRGRGWTRHGRTVVGAMVWF